MTRLLILLLLTLTLPVRAQSDCGNGLPCGSLPWSIPQFGSLRSPTPISDGLANPVPTATPTLSNTPTPVASFTPIFDPANIQNPLSTIQAVVEATAEVTVEVVDAQGTPISEGDFIDNSLSNTQMLFGYLKGYSSQTFGVLAPIVDFVIFAILFMLANIASRLFLLLASDLLGLFKRIISFILEFIPF